MANIGIVVLSASPAIIAADGVSQSLLTATVTQPNGDPLQGVAVSFATNAGVLSWIEDSTDQNGQAVVSLTSGSAAATAAITATCQTFSAQTQVEIAAGAVNRLVFEEPMAEEDGAGFPDLTPADGQTAAFPTAALHDSAGNPIAGQTVTFATSLGTLSGTQGATDESGITQVSLTSSQVGVARVTGSSGGVTAEIDVVFSAVGGLRLGPAPAAVPADGLSQTSLLITLAGSTGAPQANTPVSLTTTLGSLSASQVTTDANGQATVNFTGGVTPGIAEITATGGGFSSQVLLSVNALEIVRSALPNILPANGAATAGVSAFVTDTAGTPVADGTPVSFQTTWGTFPGGGLQILVTTTNGKATATLTAGPSPPSGGTFDLTATCRQASRSIFVWVGTGAAPIRMTITQPAEGAAVSGAAVVTDGVVNVDLTQITEQVSIDLVNVYVDDVLVDTLTGLQDSGGGVFSWAAPWAAHYVATPSGHVVTAIAEFTLTDPNTQATRKGAAEDRNALTLNNTPQSSQPRLYQGAVQLPTE